MVESLLRSLHFDYFVQNVQVTMLSHYTILFSMLRSLCSGHQAQVTTLITMFSMLRSLESRTLCFIMTARDHVLCQILTHLDR